MIPSCIVPGHQYWRSWGLPAHKFQSETQEELLLLSDSGSSSTVITPGGPSIPRDREAPDVPRGGGAMITKTSASMCCPAAGRSFALLAFWLRLSPFNHLRLRWNVRARAPQPLSGLPAQRHVGSFAPGFLPSSAAVTGIGALIAQIRAAGVGQRSPAPFGSVRPGQACCSSPSPLYLGLRVPTRRSGRRHRWDRHGQRS